MVFGREARIYTRQRQRCADPEAAARARPRLEGAAHSNDTLPHSDDAVPAPARSRSAGRRSAGSQGLPGSVVVDRYVQRRRPIGQAPPRTRAPAVLKNGRQRFLNDPPRVASPPPLPSPPRPPTAPPH